MSEQNKRKDNLHILDSIRYSTTRIEGFRKDGGTITGDIVVTNIAVSNFQTISNIPNNLGFVIKSNRLVELEKLFKKDENMDVIVDQDDIIDYLKK